MRTTEERIQALRARAAELERARRRRIRLLQAGSAAACFGIIAALAFLMPGLTDTLAREPAAESMRASIFSGGSALGFLVIGVLAFLLGIAVTVFCFYLHKREKDRGDRP